MLQLCVHMCEGVETFLRKPQNRAVDTSHALCQNVAKLSGNKKKDTVFSSQEPNGLKRSANIQKK